MDLLAFAVPARSPAQPLDNLPVTISGGWAGERAGTVGDRKGAQ